MDEDRFDPEETCDFAGVLAACSTETCQTVGFPCKYSERTVEEKDARMLGRRVSSSFRQCTNGATHRLVCHFDEPIFMDGL